MGENKALTVFVSYSHEDEQYLQEVLPFLEQLELNEHIRIWNDEKLGVGEDWYRLLHTEMRDAKVAILLITQNFLASSFCKREEVPVLLQGQREGRLAVFPLLVEDCFWEDEPWLKRLQMIPRGKALTRSGDERKAVLTELARKVRDIALRGVQAPETALKEWPVEVYDLRKLPETGALLFGRRKELALLDAAWDGAEANVVVFTAGGGVGKSTLCRVWCEMLAQDRWRGAHRAYAWSFHSQGTGRQSSADTFISAAFAWFGEDPGDLSPWDRGARLAELVRKERMLLVLDGVEPLQSNSLADQGALQDPALRTLLEELAKENPGLCLVSTRERMTDLWDFPEAVVVHHDLEQVSTLAGRALFRIAGVGGEDKELEAAVDALGGHALAVNLMASYIADTGGRHIATIQDLPEPDPAHDRDAHPRRVIEAWAKRLGESPEADILHQLGLFDRPAQGPELDALREAPPILGLNRELRAGDYEEALARLREARLLARANRHEPDAIDAHPLVRQHFAERLRKNLPAAWREGHNRLFEHLKDETKDLPDDLEGMTALSQAVAHGCQAGRHQEALDGVYRQRMHRGKEAYNQFALGAISGDLAAVSHFFDRKTSDELSHQPAAGLTTKDKGYVLNEVGWDLRALGRLADAIEPMKKAMEFRRDAGDWIGAANSAANLSVMHLQLGEVAQALVDARQGVELAEYPDDRSGPWGPQHSYNRAFLGEALHNAGQMKEAEKVFRTAEEIQRKSDEEHPLLYCTMAGFLYCDFLLDQGKYQEVKNRVSRTLVWNRERKMLRDIALDQLSLGRAYLLEALRENTGDLSEAAYQMDLAVDGLRQAGQRDYLLLGLLARARLQREQKDFPEAWADIQGALKIAKQGSMRLHEADAYLESTSLCMEEGKRDEARDYLDRAKKMIVEMGYHRRDGEVEVLEGLC